LLTELKKGKSMPVLGLGLMSTRDYENFIKKANEAAQPYKDQGRILFAVDHNNQLPHATILFVNTDRKDEFIRETLDIEQKTDPLKVVTTRKMLAKDGMREEQNEKTIPLQKLQDRAIRKLVPLAKVRGILPDGTRIIWPKENPTGKRLDETIPKLSKEDPERQQYEAIGYDEANGDKHLLQGIVAGKPRTEQQLQQALDSQEKNPFNRFRPHETEFRLQPESLTDKDMRQLNSSTDARTIEYDYLVVSQRGPNGTFSKPIAAFNLHK
jgi:hypothetical protein